MALIIFYFVLYSRSNIAANTKFDAFSDNIFIRKFDFLYCIRKLARSRNKWEVMHSSMVRAAFAAKFESLLKSVPLISDLNC